MEKLLNEFFAKWGLGDKEKKRLPLLLGVLLLGICLMAVSARLPKSPAAGAESYAENAPPEEAGQTAPSDEQQLEDKLAEILSHIRDAGEVRVSLTFADSGQTEYAVNASTTMRTTEEQSEDGSSRSTTEQTNTDTLVLAENSNKPLAVQSRMPEVQGVLVVAQGGGSPAVCREISAALQNLLGIAAHKIVICPMQ